MEKRCLACGLVKPLEDFRSNGWVGKTQRRKSRCKACRPSAKTTAARTAERKDIEADFDAWLKTVQAAAKHEIDTVVTTWSAATPYVVDDLAASPEGVTGVAAIGQDSRVSVQQDSRAPDVDRFPSVKAFDLSDVLPRIEVIDEKITHVEEHRLKVKNAELAARVKQLTAELSDAHLLHDVVEAARAVPVEPIAPRERRSGIREGTALVLASDWHVEEEVRPEQVAGRNRYNLDISRQRMTRFAEAVRWGIGFSRQAFKVRDLVLWLGGDFFTNFLHPDNVETNLLSPPEAVAYAMDGIASAIDHQLLDPELERIVLPCNDGNHGRMTEKMRSANRTAMSLETMMYGLLAQRYYAEPRVQFLIAEGSQLYYDVYGRTIRFTHGDETKYGGGVGGFTIPVYRAMARWQTVRHADLTCIGHYHQHTSLSDLIANGSLIGFSPYSLSIGARFESPAQCFTMLDPRRFKGMSMPLWVSERADDDDATHDAAQEVE